MKIKMVVSQKTQGKNKLIFSIKTKPHLNFHLLMAEERHKKWNNSRVDDHLDLLVASVRQIRQSPHCVYEDLDNATVTQLNIMY